jgi:hypothetical protein
LYHEPSKHCAVDDGVDPSKWLIRRGSHHESLKSIA